jgi:leader peptidase (prepilin peptidase)/N-methyltransferase
LDILDLLNTPLLLAGVFLLGLMIGSFLNVVILRLPRMMEYEWRCQCEELLDERNGVSGDDPELVASDAEPPRTEKKQPPSLTHPPSTCPGCGHRIRPWENVPVLSWVFLHGKCSACGQGISARYPLVELLTGLAFAVVAWQLGPTPLMLAGLVFTALLIAMAGIDLDTQLLPDSLTLPLLWLGLLLSVPTLVPSLFASLFNLEMTIVRSSVLPVSPTDSILGAAFGYGVLWLVFQAFRLATGKEGMGYGDFKLLGALGAWMGWQMLLPIVIISAGLGSVIGIAMLVTGLAKRTQPIPFGPYLALAGWIAFLWGNDLMQAFLSAYTP